MSPPTGAVVKVAVRVRFQIFSVETSMASGYRGEDGAGSSPRWRWVSGGCKAPPIRRGWTPVGGGRRRGKKKSEVKSELSKVG